MRRCHSAATPLWTGCRALSGQCDVMRGRRRRGGQCVRWPCSGAIEQRHLQGGARSQMRSVITCTVLLDQVYYSQSIRHMTDKTVRTISRGQHRQVCAPSKHLAGAEGASLRLDQAGGTHSSLNVCSIGMVICSFKLRIKGYQIACQTRRSVQNEPDHAVPARKRLQLACSSPVAWGPQSPQKSRQPAILRGNLQACSS